jgi:hypothetical protein
MELWQDALTIQTLLPKRFIKVMVQFSLPQVWQKKTILAHGTKGPTLFH